jgi:hypothetical protein
MTGEEDRELASRSHKLYFVQVLLRSSGRTQHIEAIIRYILVAAHNKTGVARVNYLLILLPIRMTFFASTKSMAV